MGSWFSNIHIRKKDSLTTEAVLSCIDSVMAMWGYEPVASEVDADGTVAVIFSQESHWVSVYSELLAHDDGDSCREIAGPISEQLHTDVLGISCFDSDYLYLNLINTQERVDAWADTGNGKDVGIDRRTGLAAWKKKVFDYAAFAAVTKQKYICAEQFVMQMECSLGLPAMQAMGTQKDAAGLGKSEHRYFRLKEAAVVPGVSQLELDPYDAKLPCLMDRCSKLSVYSTGVESCGISVFFQDPVWERTRLLSLMYPWG